MSDNHGPWYSQFLLGHDALFFLSLPAHPRHSELSEAPLRLLQLVPIVFQPELGLSRCTYAIRTIVQRLLGLAYGIPTPLDVDLTLDFTRARARLVPFIPSSLGLVLPLGLFFSPATGRPEAVRG
jgi:hypothetical protein